MASMATEDRPGDGQQILVGFAAIGVGVVLFIAGAVTLRPWLGRAVAGFVIGPSVLIVVGYILVRFGGATRARLGLASPRWRHVGEGLLGATAISAGTLLVVVVFHGFDAATETVALIAGLDAMARLPYFGIGVAAALTEEPIFRGYLQPAFIGKFGAPIGIVAVAMLFAVAHGNLTAWPPTPLIGKLASGLGFGLLRGRGRSLYPSMVAHTAIWTLWGDA